MILIIIAGIFTVMATFAMILLLIYLTMLVADEIKDRRDNK